MSILIHGMEMPKNCFGCHLFKLDDRDLWCIANHYAGYCRALSKYIDENKFVNERHSDCPLIELPPHGRLADIDKIIEDYWDGNHMEIDENDLKAISKYKVIIESERGKANDTH